MTGYIPYYIKSDSLPLERQDIFGTVHEHKEEPAKRIIPIKVVSDVVDAASVTFKGMSQLALVTVPDLDAAVLTRACHIRVNWM